MNILKLKKTIIGNVELVINGAIETKIELKKVRLTITKDYIHFTDNKLEKFKVNRHQIMNIKETNSQIIIELDNFLNISILNKNK